jgi:phenylalanyl-tRNA synthetase alpha chain
MNNLDKVLSDFNLEISNLKNKQQLEEIRIKFLGKKSAVVEAFSSLKNLPSEEKKSLGEKINQLRNLMTEKIDELKENFENQELEQKLLSEKIDLTAPTRKDPQGFIHPLSQTIQEVEKIFAELGFEFATGPEIEDDFHNFAALNISPNHPARQMQDTFYLKNSEKLLRTHTSTVQIRKMLNSKPPLKVAALGRVFRRDSDQTHTPMFHQFEAFVVDKNTNMANLKWLLKLFLEKFFETKNLELRFRPSFFPFTEPSAEVDVGYFIDQGRIKIGSNQKFMEILGCGMIHPNVLKNCNIDPEEFQGFAFGIGLERLTMLKHGITDLRMLFENDLRFINHFAFQAS